MRYLKCSSCSGQFKAGEMFFYDDAPVCEPCGDRLVTEAAARHYKPQVVRILDPTICSRCKTDNGDTDLRLIGAVPFCPSCGAILYAYPFPTWLKASFAALLLLLAFALWRDAPYFSAGRHLAEARRDMARENYTSAAAHFAHVLAVQPTNQEVVLLGAKAYLMTGDVAGARQFLELREQYDDNDFFKEVNGMWDRANGALAKPDSAVSAAKYERP
ncbi:MAG: tetratricopeptide repeat protein [Gemmatimonadales bacterium]